MKKFTSTVTVQLGTNQFNISFTHVTFIFRTLCKNRLCCPFFSDSDKDVNEAEFSDSDSGDEMATRGRSNPELKQRKKNKEDQRRRRMDNLSDVAEISEV